MDSNSLSEPAFDTTSLSLLAAARRQDQQAWQRMAALYQPLVQHWCRSSRVPPTDIADITQEVMSSVWRSLNDFAKSRPGDSFRGWLKTITRNKIRDHYRRNKLQGIGGSDAQLQFQEIPDLLDDSDPGQMLQEERQVLLRALDLIRAEFESTTWTAFWMTTVDGRSATDVASDLSMSAGSVRQSKYKVLRRLRCELGDLAPGLPAVDQNV